MQFTGHRGFKLHVQLTHLKRLAYLCPYCDRSTNSEQMIRQHMRSKHRGLEVKIVQNPAAGGPELTNEFWEKEYGLVCRSLKLKKKRKPNLDDTSKNEKSKDYKGKDDKGKNDKGKDDKSKDDKSKNDKSKDDKGSNVRPVPGNEKCKICGFTAMTYTGLKSHMRSHLAKPNIQCHYCTYSCSVNAELVEHWKVNHSFLPFKARDKRTTSGKSGDSQSPSVKKIRSMDVYADDIEEEQVVSADEEDAKITVYNCAYCNNRSHSLEILMRHWDLMHKEESSKSSATGLSFKYREYQLPTKVYQKEYNIMMTSHKKEREKENADESSSSRSDGWVCQWCQELCETDNDMKTHHNMFHSHLASNFKKQQQQPQQQPQQQQLQQQEDEPREFGCSVCSYTATSLVVIKKHVVKHVDLFKCKYCDKAFNTPVGVSAHSSEIHPGLPTKIESISNFDSLVKKLIKTSKLSDKTAATSEPAQKNARGVVDRPRTLTGYAVAKKSTTKSAASYVKSVPRMFKAVARKSTNPLPRYLREGMKYRAQWRSLHANSEPNEETKSQQTLSSHYGIPSEPINLDKVNTYMKVGSHVMKVTCATLAQLLKIDPKLMLKDIRYDPEYTAIFSQDV